MRTIDADALSAFVGDLRSTLHKEQTTFKAMTEIEFNTRDYMLLNFQQTIDNTPTVEEITNEDIQQAIKEGFANGYEMAKAKFERPQGEWKALNYHTCYCTNCNFDFDIMKCEFMTKMNFCPKCGAKMTKETENG